MANSTPPALKQLIIASDPNSLQKIFHLVERYQTLTNQMKLINIPEPKPSSKPQPNANSHRLNYLPFPLQKSNINQSSTGPIIRSQFYPACANAEDLQIHTANSVIMEKLTEEAEDFILSRQNLDTWPTIRQGTDPSSKITIREEGTILNNVNLEVQSSENIELKKNLINVEETLKPIQEILANKKVAND
ncbi:hypothetical protein GWI33_018891 [Rhynchophorus ferrugineus]|uniref:Uncharacterized protein n=1 Tax=Rhynchophorus ferrugineus TaxID=354439 RepID=A0A834HVJ1_RHYFE|nr:hypothetical protein GWI33_018891 [Rhynchophorus ferrugineus]